MNQSAGTTTHAKTDDSHTQSPPFPTPEEPSSELDVFVFPASFAQERLWFFEQWEPGAYNVELTTIPQGQLDLEALEKAIQEVARRHEILRTTFAMVDSQLCQLISSQSVVHFSRIDLCMFSDEEQYAKVNAIIKSESKHIFDLRHGPLLRVSIIKVLKDTHVIHFNMHHIISDAWSIEVLMSEIRTLYVAYSSGQPSPLPELPIQYADYAVWQKKCFQDGKLDAHLDYWKHQLRDVPILQLPFDYPRPAIQSFHGSKRHITIPPHLHTSLNALSRQAGVTLFMTLLAAFQTLLHRYSSQESIAVGTPIAGRDGSKLELLIGCFLNTLVLRTSFDGNPSFWNLLKRVQEVALSAYEYQDIPFEKLVEMLQPDRELSHHPLFQVMFALENVPRHNAGLSDAQLTPLSETEQATLYLGEEAYSNHTAQKHSALFKNETAVFDIDMSLYEREDKLFGEIEYNTSIFDPSTIDQLHDHFLTLLQQIVRDPMQRVDTIPLLSREEQNQYLEKWNSASFPISKLQTGSFLAGFLEQVRACPTALAVSDEQHQLTYADLFQQAYSVARYLRVQGVVQEQLVGLYTTRSVSWAAGLLGILFTGGAYLPLDPRYPDTRIQQFIKQSKCHLLLTSYEHEDHLVRLCEGMGEAGGTPPRIVRLEDAPKDAGEHFARCEDLLEPQGQQLAYVIYTSGSTGIPKGAMVEHSGMLNHLYSKVEALHLGEKDVVAQTASACFDISIWQVLAPLLTGGSVRIYADETVWNVQELFEQVVRDGVSILEVVPSWLRGLLDLDLPAPEQDDVRLGQLRWLITTGEALPRDLCLQWLKRYQHVPIMNAYGPTECSDDVTHHIISNENNEKAYRGLLPIGSALPGLRTYVLNEQMQIQPVGVAGEIYIGGIGVGRGYLGEADKTAEVFVPDPWGVEPGGRLYRTGDMGRYRSDGVILFNERKDEQIKLRGYRIELAEIEQAMQKLPGVKECRVMKRTERTNDGERLVAYVIRGEGYEDSGRLLKSMKEELPDYMLPSAIVAVEEWPLLLNGKLDKERLPDPQEEEGLIKKEVYVAPRDEIEKKLALIWSNLLGVQQVGIYDDFFALGGYSLLTIQLARHIHAQFGRRISLTTIFRERTIAAIAQMLQQHEYEDSSRTLQKEQTPKAVNLPEDAILDSSMTPGELCVKHHRTTCEHVLLTGATGFLGTFLLAELLRKTSMHIHCLIRATTEAEGQKKLQQKLEEANIWQTEWEMRIYPIIGDLGQPQLGLSSHHFSELARRIDRIYHNGAYVNMMYPYEALRPANVLGTKEIIRLAMTYQLKPVHYISTLNVLGQKEEAHTQYLDEHVVIDDCWQYLQGGYAQSKWVAEKLVRTAHARGLPVVIYRPGMITGFPQSRAHYEDDTFYRFLEGCIELGKAPLSNRSVTLQTTSVDYVSRAIVALSQQETSFGETFHFSNVSQVALNTIVQWLNTFGYVIQLVEYQDWYKEVIRLPEISERESMKDATLLDLLSRLPKPDLVRHDTGEEQTPSVVFGSEFTQAALAKLSIWYAEVDEGLFHTYLASLLQTGQLPFPEKEQLSS